MADASTKTGLKIDRVFSDAEVSPFYQIKWAERTAEIKGESGDVIFRQERCEFPETWSQTAVNIVASKYFYGDLANGNGSPAAGQREYSVRQLIGRVAETIAVWGGQDGYFDTTADADAFQDELEWLLVQQYGAFNSPVWFNCGLWGQYGIEGDTVAWRWDEDEQRVVPLGKGESYKYPQISACFIQSVDDTMDSIMDLAKAEAMLFKAGSGTGTDLSTLRSTKEKLAGGGKPSGPVSFFRVYDTIASIVKSGGKTRRAARLNSLMCDHPDVLDFAVCKVKEDRKARALIAAGYSAGMSGDSEEAYSSVGFQNTNISLRATDEFMRKASGEDPDPLYWTKAVVDGKDVERLDARKVLRTIAEGTWECGDPGMQFHDTINKWNTASNTHTLWSSNPCGEYNYINNSSCNLASLNLMRFVNEDGEFNASRFEAAARIFIIAQDILVDRASYPTESIAQNSHDYRPLGLGFANIGALLMTSGLPYDSDKGRSYAGAVAALMQASAAKASIEIAQFKGPFQGFSENKGPACEVMMMHASAAASAGQKANRLAGDNEYLRKLWGHACVAWSQVIGPVKTYGCRNGQLSVTAPCGTIGFLMDCSTTGLEPDIALVKYKKLAGGGMMKITNDSVPLALRRLGYGSDAVQKIVAYIDANDTIEGSPDLNPKHLPVFDCAFPCGENGRSIHWTGHVKMMAATQPFISGSQSKTANVPSTATVEEIEEAYIMAWRLGVKSIAIYRDGSKGAQPLNTKRDTATEIAVASPAVEASAPRRERLPATRRGLNHKFEIGGHEGYINIGFYPDGRPGEIFCTMSKEGSTIGGLMDAWATAISMGLQYGVPIEVLVDKFAHSRFDPAGITKNPSIPFAKSVPDYIARFLGCELISGYREANSPDRGYEAHEASPAAVESKPSESQQAQFAKFQSDAPLCGTCGSITVRNGTCYRCYTCGDSLGCS